MAEKARIDRTLIATLRERSRPMRPEASLTRPATLDDELAMRLHALAEGLAVRLGLVEERLSRLEAGLSEPTPVGHTLFASTPAGYALVECEGPPPRPGEEVSVDGTVFRAQGYRRSPFPADRRVCVIIEAVERKAD